MALSGSTVYIGGFFSGANSINGTLTRNRLAAVDATTGTATAWDPNANNVVDALAVSGSTVYIGGVFSGANSINGTLTRNRLAAVDATTGTATAWDPNANNGVDALAPDGGGGVIAGGVFSALDLGAQEGVATFSAAPAGTSAPVVSGTLALGQTLSCSQGAWSGTMPQSYAYQWLRDGVAIAGAIAPSYMVAPADLGHALSCRVTASNLGGSASAVAIVDQPPTAVFNAPTGAVAGSPTGFDGSGSSDPDGTIAGYSWDFGDGSATGSGVTPAHTYATAGAYTVKLTVTDNAGNTGSVTHQVTVAARGTKTTLPPIISGERISPSALVPERGSGPSATTSRKRGARVTFKLSEAATVTFTIRRNTPGRKVGRGCVKQTRSNRNKKKCSRLVAVGTFTRAGVKGSNSFHLTGRAKGRPLPLGDYVLTAVATDKAGKRSKPASRPFRIIR